ncbi:ribose-5-phosphate isomerase rki1, partial [Coemansia spiralis]
MSAPSLGDRARRSAAFAAVDKHVTPEVRVLGVGTGSTVVFAVERLAELKQQGRLHPDLVCVPTSFQSTQLIADAGLRTADLNDLQPLDPAHGCCASIEVTIDGADEVDAELNVIKGGGAAHLREKVVAAASKKLVIIGDYRKDATVLGEKWEQGIPVEVTPIAWRSIKSQLERFTPLSRGRAVSEPAAVAFEYASPVATLRQAVRKAGPVVTDNGNFVLDVRVGKIFDPAAVEQAMKMIPGVIEVGIFTAMASE